MIVRKIKAKDPVSGNKQSELLLFFAGWGMDERPFLAYLLMDKDCMICYDYRSLTFDESLLKDYDTIHVVAWSMGVWAASRVFAGSSLPIVESIAINGTPYPVDDERGIPTQIFNGTVEGLNEENLFRFRRRMCGSTATLNLFLENTPKRKIEDLREELQRIGELSTIPSITSFQWDKAYIGKNDKIFPPANQQKAWENIPSEILDCAHYPYPFWERLFKETK